MTDSHCHLYLEQFNEDADDVIARATASGVTQFFLPAIDSSTHEQMMELESKYKGICIAMMGLHPCSVKSDFIAELEIIKRYLSQRKFAAIGEIGLDLYWDKTFLKEQYDAFHEQVNLALQYSLPMVIHSREATNECIEVVEQYTGRGLKGIFHCFGGTTEQAQRIINCGFLLGIGGVVTYKNSGLAEVIKDIDLMHIVLETDAPYLSPVPYRGKRNESSYLTFIADKIASTKNIAPAEVHKATDDNCRSLFAPIVE